MLCYNKIGNTSIPFQGEFKLKWDNTLNNGAILLNQNISYVQSKDVSFRIHYWGAKPQHYNNKPHQHSFFELCYVVGGKGQYIENNQAYPLLKDTLYLSRPYIKHQILSDTGLDILFVGFEIDHKETKEDIGNLFHALENTEHFMLKDARQSPVLNLWKSLLTLVHEPLIQSNDGFQGLCITFFLSVLKQFNDEGNQPLKPKNHIAADLVYEAKLYIHDNLHRTLKLDDVANHIYISGRHLSRIFKSELGQTFSSYVRKERVRKAGTLLLETDYTHDKIAEMTGFDNVHYFSSVFSSEMGLPPGKFREKFARGHDESLGNVT